MKGKMYVGMGIVIVLLVVVFMNISSTITGYSVLKDFDGGVDFYKSPSCGCCGLHSNYLSGRGGLNVNEILISSTTKIKEDYGIPRELRTCHTAVIDGYFVEGHVPLEAINKLIEEKPDIAGIALPGMPSGSPGMPGPKTEEWIIYSVNHDGTYGEFMRI